MLLFINLCIIGKTAAIKENRRGKQEIKEKSFTKETSGYNL
jgi:hypothetical protein